MSGSGSSDYPDVPTGYDESAYFTISSLSDAHTFSERFNKSNGYSDSTTNTTLALGNRININDGTYNTQWMIAGFDVEYNRTATDGITYNNGYGIALIPVNYVSTGVWDNNANHIYTSTFTRDKKTYTYSVYGNTSYSNSDIDTFCNNTMITALQTVLGDHIVNRNVLLADSVYRYSVVSAVALGSITCYYMTQRSTNYSWMNRYATSMSVMQLIGQDMSSVSTTNNTEGLSQNYNFVDIYGNKFDQGEANYKLPLFDNIGVGIDTYNYWTRTPVAIESTSTTIKDTYVREFGNFIDIVPPSGFTNSTSCSTWCHKSAAYRPMIYIR